ncbi:stalk domain-containing protein [Paenibacillus puerhi]|uniref:stalk domain-containing protein n=1 Tax=Paenibacillus puerhi TaxID=2692622 RepID=UPI00135709E8|nr:stalk domain-containing protein [Paenibacillus puerhi]
MRKTIALLSLTAAALACPFTPSAISLPLGPSASAAAAAAAPQLVINGSVLQGELPPYRGGANGDTLFAPARLVLEALGYTVSWKQEEQAISAVLHEEAVLHKPGSKVWTVDGHSFLLSDASMMQQDTLWMPVQPVAEALGLELKWSSLTQTLYIKASFAASIRETLGYGYTRLSYEGDTVDGLRHGEGRLYLDGKLWYEGSFRQNKLNGGGKLYMNGQLRYEGGFVADQPHGQAVLLLANGSRYEGDFTRGNQTGQGALYDAGGRLRYNGEWVNGLMEGVGDVYDEQGTIVYSGEMKQNRQHGYGVAFTAAGSGTNAEAASPGTADAKAQKKNKIYEGQWADNVRSGQGRSFDASGKLEYIGSWSNDKKDGDGFAYKLSMMDWSSKNDQGELITETLETIQLEQVTYRKGMKIAEGDKYLYTGLKLADGTPHGSGTMYYDSGKLRATSKGALHGSLVYYEGEFVQGRMSGMGKLYDKQERLVYEGEVVDGKRSGHGTSYENGVLAYEGKWSDDQRSGLGRRYTFDKSYTGPDFTGSSSLLMHEGRFAADKETEAIAVYRHYGQFLNGLPDGYGAVMLLHDYKNESGPKSLDKEQGTAWLIYEGEFRKGLREGDGRLYENNTLVYEGQFSKGLREGIGMAYEDRMIYKGPFKDDLKEGEGEIFDAFDTLRFKGTFKNGKKNGFGRLYSENGLLSYEGQFKNDWKHGYGKLFGSDGKTPYYQGEFREDKTLSQYLNDMKEKP